LIEDEPNLVVTCQAENARQAQCMAESGSLTSPLWIITLPDKGGIELIEDLKALRPEMAVLVDSRHNESLYAERALRAGARVTFPTRKAAQS
jgi:DNA-binding NarL/FixJ family response regulator